VTVTTSLPDYRTSVRDEWIDYNGHLSEAYYVLVFGFATDALMDAVGLDANYRTETDCSLYTVEAHVQYLQEVPSGAGLAVRTRILGVDERKLRFCHEMYVDEVLVATEELFALHVPGVFPAAVRSELAGLVTEAPTWAGRSIRVVG
jgi:acyl-CoA thioester hydrolase